MGVGFDARPASNFYKYVYTNVYRFSTFHTANAHEGEKRADKRMWLDAQGAWVQSYLTHTQGNALLRSHSECRSQHH